MFKPTTGAIIPYSDSQFPPNANKPDSEKKTPFIMGYMFKFFVPDQTPQTTANKRAFVATRLLFNRRRLPDDIFHIVATLLVPDTCNLEPMPKHIGQLYELNIHHSYKKDFPEQKKEILPNILRAADYFSINCNQDKTHRNIFFKTMLRINATASIISAINALNKNEWTMTPERRTMQLDLLTVLLKVIEYNSRLPHEVISPEFLRTLFDILKQPVCEASEQIGTSTDDIRELACKLLEKTVGYAKDEEEGEWIRCALLHAGILDLATAFVEYSVGEGGCTGEVVLARSAGLEEQALIGVTSNTSVAGAAASESSRRYKLIKETVNLKLSELLVIFHTHSPLLQWNDRRRIVRTLAMLLSQIETEADQGNMVAKETRRNCEQVILGILLLLSDETYEEGIKLLIEILPYPLYSSIFPYCLHTEEETSLLQQQTTFSGKSNLLRNQLKPALIILSNEFYLEKERLRKMMLFDTHALNPLPLALECNRLTKQIKVIAGELPDWREAHDLYTFLVNAPLLPPKFIPSIVQNLCSIANIMLTDEILNSYAIYLCLSLDGPDDLAWKHYECLISVFKFQVNETGEAIITNEKEKLLVKAALHVLILLMDTEKRIRQERDRGNTNILIHPALQTLKDLYLRQELIKFLSIQDLADLAKDVISRCSNDDSSFVCADKEQVAAVKPCRAEDIKKIARDLGTLDDLQGCQRDIPPEAVVAALNLFFNSQHASKSHRETFLDAICDKNMLLVLYSALDTLTKSELIKTRVGQEMQYQLISVLSRMFADRRYYIRMFKDIPDGRLKILLNGMKALLQLNRDHVHDLGSFVELLFSNYNYPIHKDNLFSGLEMVIMLLESTDDENIEQMCRVTLHNILRNCEVKKDLMKRLGNLMERLGKSDRFLSAISNAFLSQVFRFTSFQICRHIIEASDTLTIRLFDKKYHVLDRLLQMMLSEDFLTRSDAHSLIFDLLRFQPKIFKKLIGNNPDFVKPLLAGMISDSKDKHLNLMSLICLGNMIGTDDGLVEQRVREGMTRDHFKRLKFSTRDLVYNDTPRSLSLFTVPLNFITSPVNERELSHLRLQLPLEAVLNLSILLLNSEEIPSLSPDGNNRFLEMFEDIDPEIWEDLRTKYPYVSEKVDRLLEKL